MARPASTKSRWRRLSTSARMIRAWNTQLESTSTRIRLPMPGPSTTMTESASRMFGKVSCTSAIEVITPSQKRPVYAGQHPGRHADARPRGRSPRARSSARSGRPTSSRASRSRPELVGAERVAAVERSRPSGGTSRRRRSWYSGSRPSSGGPRNSSAARANSGSSPMPPADRRAGRRVGRCGQGARYCRTRRRRPTGGRRRRRSLCVRTLGLLTSCLSVRPAARAGRPARRRDRPAG